MTDIDDLRNRVGLIISGPATAESSPPPAQVPQTGFSAFDTRHVRKATALASRFMEIADAQGGEEGLAAAVQEMENMLREEKVPGLVQHAVRLFLAHHKEASEKLGKR